MTFSLNKLPTIKSRSSKRLGRGYGSGKGGHTSSRGQKGQKSRTSMPLLFEGSKQRKSLIRRTPFLRGKAKNKPVGLKPIAISLYRLEVYKSGETIDLSSLLTKGILKKNQLKQGAKIVAVGQLKKKLIVLLPTTVKAKELIVKAGGEVKNVS
jgi:large subunit ribosomal protein L15